MALSHTTPALLAQELVWVYDLLDRALLLALERVEASPPVSAYDECVFWDTWLTLSVFLERTTNGQISLREWLLEERANGMESPLTSRRADLERLRRELEGPVTPGDR
jgi:hypothetical protein